MSRRALAALSCSWLLASAAHAQEAPTLAPATFAAAVATATTTSTAAPAPAPGSPLITPAPADPALLVLDVPTATAATDLSAPVAFEVEVRARRTVRTAGSAHVLRERDLERFQQDDVHQVLYAVPGVYMRGEDGSGLRPNIAIRGTNPDRSKKLTLMEDGILFAPAPYSASAAYFFPMITRMSELRVLKGPAAIGYGPHTVGGAIDLITRAIPAEPAASVDLAAGMYGYGKLHAWAGTTADRFGFLIEGVHLREDGFKHLPDPDASTGFYKNEWMAKASYRHDGPGDTRGELRLKLGFSNERSNETYVGLTDADFRADPLQRYGISQLDQMNFYRTSAALTHLWDLAPRLSVSTTVYRHDLSRSWRKVNDFRGASLFRVLTDPEDSRNAVFYDIVAGRAASSTLDEMLMVGPNQREFVSEGLDVRARAEADTGPLAHRLELGARLHYDRVERRHSEDGFAVRGDVLEPEGSPTVVTAFNEASTLAAAFNASDVVTWGDLTLSPGVRVEIIRSTFTDRASGAESVRSHAVVLPGLGAFYAILPQLGVLASVHRGFSPPAPALGTDNDPELSIAYEAGARFSHRGLRAELIGYYNDYSNLTDVCTLASGCADENLDRQFDAGEAEVYGLEALVGHEVPLGAGLRLPFSVAYTLSKGELSNAFTSADPIFGQVEAGDELPYLPRHQAHVTVGLEHERAGLNVAGTYVSRMREEPGQGDLDEGLTTDEQWLIDLSGRVRLIGPLVLYANLRNVIDHQAIVSRRPYGARPNAPRWLQVGLEARF